MGKSDILVSTVRYIFSPVEDVTALKAINTTNFTNRNLWIINVGDVAGSDTGGIYDYLRASSATEDLPNIVAPTTGTGRWRLKASGTTPPTTGFDYTFDFTIE
jgi:hypothetical protein